PCNMCHTFQPNPSLRAEDLETESRSCCGECSEIPRHAFLHSEEYRCGVVAVDLNGAPETLAIHMIDWTAEVDHAVNGVDTHWSQSPARGFFAICPPLGRFEQQCIREGHRRFNVHHGAQATRTDALAKLVHFRMKTPVI